MVAANAPATLPVGETGGSKGQGVSGEGNHPACTQEGWGYAVERAASGRTLSRAWGGTPKKSIEKKHQQNNNKLLYCLPLEQAARDKTDLRGLQSGGAADMEQQQKHSQPQQFGNPYAGIGFGHQGNPIAEIGFRDQAHALLDAALLDLWQPDITDLATYGSAEDFINAKNSRRWAAGTFLVAGSAVNACALLRKTLRESTALLGVDHEETISAKLQLEEWESYYAEAIEQERRYRAEWSCPIDGDVVAPKAPSRTKEHFVKAIEHEIELHSIKTIAPSLKSAYLDVLKENAEIDLFDQVIADAADKPRPAIPPKILTLGRALRLLLKQTPLDKLAFAEAVTTTLIQTNFCIRVLPEGLTARRMVVNSTGSLQLACTNGRSVGLTRRTDSVANEPREFELIPYQRNSPRSSLHSVNP